MIIRNHNLLQTPTDCSARHSRAKKKARMYHERHNPNRIYLVLLPVLNGLLQKNKRRPLFTGTTCFDVDDLCFPTAFLGPHIPEVHIHTDGKATASHKPRHRCKFTYKQPDKLKLLEKTHNHTNALPSSSQTDRARFSGGLDKRFYCRRTVSGAESQAAHSSTHRVHCYPCQINMLAGGDGVGGGAWEETEEVS